MIQSHSERIKYCLYFQFENLTGHSAFYHILVASNQSINQSINSSRLCNNSSLGRDSEWPAGVTRSSRLAVFSEQMSFKMASGGSDRCTVCNV